MLYGAGSLFVRTSDLSPTSLRGENLVHPLCIAGFELTFDDSLAEAKCLVDGRKQISAAAITETIASMKLTFEFVDWTILQLAFDELAQSTSTIVLPVLKTATVNSSNEVVDTELTSATGVYVYRKTPQPGKYYEIITTGTPTADQAKVDTAATKLVFASSEAGAVVQYTVNKTYTTIESIGKESTYDKFGKLSFSGIISGTEFSTGMQIVVPQLSRVSTPALTITGELARLEIDFRASVAPGFRSVFQLYNLDT